MVVGVICLRCKVLMLAKEIMSDGSLKGCGQSVVCLRCKVPVLVFKGDGLELACEE